MSERPAQIEALTPVRGLGALRTALRLGGLVGIGLGAAAIACLFNSGPDSWRRILFAYLVAFSFFLSLSLGALFFVALQHVTRAGWSVSVRRPAEILAANFGVLIILAIPIIVALPLVYRWVHPLPGDNLPADKSLWLNRPFFAARVLGYLVIWWLLGRAFWAKSIRQDKNADPALTLQMQKLSPAALLLFAVTVNFAAFDLLMSLDPHWYSTIFGVYFFSGCVVGFLAGFILILRVLQKACLTGDAVTPEHYHDLGKLLFAFVFFWGYIAFSQYLLIWYANLPEETGWFIRRGATTVAKDVNLFTALGVALILGHFALPFLGLLSRHAKRSLNVLCFWCVLLLAMHLVDLFWLVRPEMLFESSVGHGSTVPVTAIDVLALPACLLGLGGFYLFGAVRLAGERSMVAVGDPRLKESVAFEQPF